ncbi:MAG: hypothetical protein WC522_00995 [Candidatus Omnitrophota bacterium]
MERRFHVLLAVVLVLSLTGCDAVQRKFTRKKKVVKAPRIYQIKKYPVRPPAELYKKHYSYWQSWQAELIQVFGQNSKKDKRCVEEAIGQLKDMRNILIPSKAEELERHIGRMEEARNVILRSQLTFANRDSLRMTFEREERVIRREFAYDKVKDSLRKTMEEEEPPKLTMAEGAGIESQK